MKVFFAIFLLVSCSYTAFACSCMVVEPEPKAADILQDIRAVFLGKVISIGLPTRQRLKNSRGRYYDGMSTYEVEFEVLKSWKGVETEKIKIETATLSCHTQFKWGKEYVVLASGDKLFEVDYCTKKFVSLEDIKNELGEGKVFEKHLSSLETPSSPEGFWSILWKKIVSFFS